MDLFLPWANAMLVEQIDNELPVKWTDLVHRCSSVKYLALELVKFFDINTHWKHRELYEALTVIAGLKKTEDKSLNSLDLRLRVETLLDMKLKGEDFQTRGESRKLEKETKITENLKGTCMKTEQSAETTGSRERKKKKRRDHEKIPGEKKRNSKHIDSAKEKEHVRIKDPHAVETEHKERTRKAKSVKETKVTESNIKKQIHVYESVTDARLEKKEGNSRKKSSERNVKKKKTKERQKRDVVSDGDCKSRETKEREINNNCVESKSNKELTLTDIGTGERHRSYISTEEWDPNTEEFVV